MSVLFLQFYYAVIVIYICSSNVVFLYNLFNFSFILMRHLIVIISSFIIYLSHKICTL